jgi:multidrug resistance efflux pump
MTLSGSVVTDKILKLRFSSSGRISSVNFQVGDEVKKGQLLARLDSSDLQTRLDRELKQYEKVRADFEQKSKKELNEFDRTQLQAGLDISVKNVELAKQSLDSINLHSPVTGIVIDADPAVAGMNITPAGFTVSILDPASLYFEAAVVEKDLSKLEVGQKATIKLVAFPKQKLTGTVVRIGYVPNRGKYPVNILLEETAPLRLGLTGKANW